MALLSVRDLRRQFDAEPVLDNVSFEVRGGDRIGLIGPNGAGKTTLLNILVERDHQDSGEVVQSPSAEIALLEQETDFPPQQTLLAEARRGLAHLYELQNRCTRLSEQLAGEKDAVALQRLQKRYDDVQQELHRHNAYHIDHRVDEVLHGLGFSDDEYDRPLRTFSGGEQNRALLARLLLRAPDVMLLDEPTNHLDIAATEWLEKYLSECRTAVVLVSHDRYFLDRVTNRIFELMSGRLTDYPGNFSAYRRQREDRVKVLHRTFEKRQEFIAKTEDFIRRNKYGQKHAQAADREKKLARLEAVDRPPEEPALHMTFGEPSRTGDWVIDAVKLAKGFDVPLFEDFTLRIHRGDRIGILGPNGSGKTTLLRTLIGELEPDAGTVRHGTHVRIGYFDQQLESVNPELDAVDATRPPDNPAFLPGEARSLLGRFGLSGDIVFQKVGSLSGGEKSRVALARIAAANVNLLVLDEPTNHLDLWACDALERSFREFPGTLLFVSHDRYFVDRIATSVIVHTDDGWKQYDGNYSDFLGFTRNVAAETAAPSDARFFEKSGRLDGGSGTKPAGRSGTGEAPKPSRRKFAYRKVPDIEADIAEHEEVLEQLQSNLADPDLHRDGERVKETMSAFAETQEKLSELYEHWEEAMELN
ncbi:MAG: ABC-F family ATP-binding cassette domain-containing protein [Planctomycetaceae bacterium]